MAELSRQAYGLDPTLDWIGLDDCDHIFKLVISAAQLMLFLSNYDFITFNYPDFRDYHD